MKKTRKLTLLLLTVLALTLMMGLNASAATRRKLIKTVKEYNAKGKLTYVNSYKYNSKGDTTSRSWKNYDNGKVVDKGKVTMKRSYYKGTRRVKKITYKNSGSKYTYSYTYTYNSRGATKTSVYKNSDGGYSKTTYKTSGSRIKSSVTKDKNGKKTNSAKYDSHGNLKSSTYYYDGGKSTTTYKYTYKKGIVRKEVAKYSDGEVDTWYYNSHGDLTKSVYKYDDNTYTYKYKNKYKGGYMKERTSYYYNKDKKKYEKTGKSVYTYTSKTYTLR